MVKNSDAMSDAVLDSQHPFQQVDSLPQKQKKHRYERRKVRQFLNHGDWVEAGDNESPPR
jgi:hypothetical protein